MSEFTRFSASPEDTYRPFKRRRGSGPRNDWTAPEHHRFARNMERDYPVDHNGKRMIERGRELLLDPRPEIMIPKRKPINLGVDV